MNRQAIGQVGIILIISLFAYFFALAGSQNGLTLSNGLPLFGICIVLVFLIQFLAFIPADLQKTEKFYDLTGSFTYIIIVLIAVWLGGNKSQRSILLVVFVIVWTVRLGVFLFLRVLRSGEDSRFVELKKSSLRFLLVWIMQALWISITISAALAAITSTKVVEIGIWGIFGTILWLFGFVIEAIADIQKFNFKKNSENKGKFINSGLWSKSRHPNYFGEIVLWIGIAIIAIPVLQGWQFITLISPLFVILLLTKVSGIPILEKQGDERWGGQNEYEEYKENTPVLIPKFF